MRCWESMGGWVGGWVGGCMKRALARSPTFRWARPVACWCGWVMDECMKRMA